MNLKFIKNNCGLIGCWIISIIIIFYMVFTNFNNPKLLKVLALFPLLVIGGAFSIFGKDLFRKTEGMK